MFYASPRKTTPHPHNANSSKMKIFWSSLADILLTFLTLGREEGVQAMTTLTIIASNAFINTFDFHNKIDNSNFNIDTRQVTVDSRNRYFS